MKGLQDIFTSTSKGEFAHKKRRKLRHLAGYGSLLGGITVLLSIILFFSNCKKVATPPPSENTPVFNLQAELNNNALSLAAGNDNYFLFTDFEKDENDVHTFIGTFAKIDCLDECQDTFRIKIRDFQAVSANQVDIEEALSQPFYPYKNNNLDFFVTADTTIFQNPTFDGTGTIGAVFGTTYNWTIFDSLDFNGDNFTLSFINPTTEPFVIALAISTNQNTCQSEQRQIAQFTSDTLLPILSVEIVPDTIGGLEAVTVGTPPFSYLWNTGEINASINTNPATDNYSVTVSDAEGNLSYNSINIFGYNINCQARASFSAETTLQIDSDTTFVNDPLKFSNITIEYVNANGDFYSTELENQPASSFFEIQSVEEFETNQNGQPTKKVGVEFECMLFSENGNVPIAVKNAVGTIGVAYPQ